MIARLVAFALHQRFITLALAGLLTAGCIVSFYCLPAAAHPDVAEDNRALDRPGRPERR